MSRSVDNRPHFSIAPTLVVSIGMLVILSVGAILALQWFSSTAIVGTLGSRVIKRNLEVMELGLRSHLDAVVDQAAFVAGAVRSGTYTFAERDRLSDFLAGSLAAAPQIRGMVLIDADKHVIRVSRGRGDGSFVKNEYALEEDPQLLEIASTVPDRQSPFWGAPVFREQLGQTILNYRVPVRKDGEFQAFLGIGVATETLSELASELSDPPLSTVFVLYGQNRLLAHADMPSDKAGLGPGKPLLQLSEVSDAVLAGFSRAKPYAPAGITPPVAATIARAEVEGIDYIYITKQVGGYGELPLIIGSYSPLAAVDAPLRTLYTAALVGVLVLVISLVLAALLSRLISRPVRRVAGDVARIGSLDFDRISPAKPSYLREIDDLASAFNAMLDGLKAFGRYVPRSLVTRLIKEGRVDAGSEERELTVMFTDIAGFTSICEGMSASEVADFINHHLTLVSECIEAEGGTIDKYIGDAVMAFWGAPDTVENTAASACRAALAIRTAISEDNAKRDVDGNPSVSMRVGIHTGPLVVGDIGAPSRINYTVVGDVVNAAQRLEGLGKEIDPKAEITMLVSGTTRAMAGAEFQLSEQGKFQVKGKEKRLDVFRLE